MATKQREIPWEKKPLMQRVAAILYPEHVDDETRRQMQEISDADGKRSPQQVRAGVKAKGAQR